MAPSPPKKAEPEKDKKNDKGKGKGKKPYEEEDELPEEDQALQVSPQLFFSLRAVCSCVPRRCADADRTVLGIILFRASSFLLDPRRRKWSSWSHEWYANQHAHT